MRPVSERHQFWPSTPLELSAKQLGQIAQQLNNAEHVPVRLIETDGTFQVAHVALIDGVLCLSVGQRMKDAVNGGPHTRQIRAGQDGVAKEVDPA